MMSNLQLPAAAARWADAGRVAIVEEQWETYPRRREVEALVKEMIKNVPRNSILDLGCGTARYSELLEGWNVYFGVDESAPMLALAGARLKRIEAAREKVTTALVHADLRLWHARDGFDLALCLEVAPHYPDPLGFIADVMARHRARCFLVSVEAHEQPDRGDIDFKVGEELGSRSVPRAVMEEFFAARDTVALERVEIPWHPDAVDWFALVKGNV